MKERKRCPADFEIQALIDGELSVGDSDIINRHAEECSRCALRIEEMAQWTVLVKQSMRGADPSVAQVPEYSGKEGFLPERRIGPIIRRLAAIAAMVAMVVLTTTIISDRGNDHYKPTAYDLMLWEENSAGNDANRLWHNRSVTVMITGPDGEAEIINLN